MSLSARAIAVQGVGYASLVLALQGFAPVSAPEPTPAPAVVVRVGGVGRYSGQLSSQVEYQSIQFRNKLDMQDAQDIMDMFILMRAVT